MAVIVSLLEVFAGLMIYSLIAHASAPESSVKTPGIGTLERLFPHFSDETLLIAATATAGLIFILRGIAYLFQNYWRNRLAQNSGARLAEELFTGYLRMPYIEHLVRNSSELIRNLHGATYEFVSQILVPVIAVISEGLILTGMVLLLVFTAPTITLISGAVLIPVVFLTLRWVQPRLVDLGAELQDLNKRNIQSMQQSFEGIREIKILGRNWFFANEFAGSRKLAARAYYLRAAISEVPRVIAETAAVLFILIFLPLSTTQGANTGDSLAILGLFAYALLRIIPSLNRLMLNLNTMNFGSAAIDILHNEHSRLKALSDSLSLHEGAKALPFAHSLDLKNVSLRFPSSADYALRNVSLTIVPGETVGIVGPTGSGKSTLVDVILGLLEPTEGEVLVDNRSIHDNLGAWARNLGVVSQRIFLSDESLINNVAFGVPRKEIDIDRVWEALRIAQLDEFIETLPQKLDTIVGERGTRLSGGQRQRVAIARALYSRPAALILDEGTSALDSVTEDRLIRALRDSDMARTTIFIAHRVQTVRECSSIIYLHDGIILDQGTFDELIDRVDSFRQMVGRFGP